MWFVSLLVFCVVMAYNRFVDKQLSGDVGDDG